MHSDDLPGKTASYVVFRASHLITLITAPAPASIPARRIFAILGRPQFRLVVWIQFVLIRLLPRTSRKADEPLSDSGEAADQYLPDQFQKLHGS